MELWLLSYHFGKLLTYRFSWHPLLDLKFNGLFIVLSWSLQNFFWKLFCLYSDFFWPWQKATQEVCFGPLKKNLWKWHWNSEILAKMHFFQKVAPIFFTFLIYRYKNLNFLLSKWCWNLKFLKNFQNLQNWTFIFFEISASLRKQKV